jgi:20S proteasome alpha/beta subunit
MDSMTTIIGYVTNELVLFCADRQRNSLSLNGDFQGVNSRSMKKIYKISEKIAIAAGGVTEPIEAAIEKIKIELLHQKFDLLTIIEICKREFTVALNNFIQNHPGITYRNLYFLLGGIVNSTGEPFLFSFRSDKNFEGINYELIQLVTMGDGHKDISASLPKKLESTPALLNEKYFLYSQFSKAIRDCSPKYATTGAETYLYLITKNGIEEQYRDAIGNILNE